MVEELWRRPGARRSRRLSWWVAVWLGVLLVVLGATAGSAAQINVNTLDDSESDDGLCSLREAIVAANTDSEYLGCPEGELVDDIQIAVGGTIELTADLPDITRDVNIRGLGPSVTVVDGLGQYGIISFFVTRFGDGNKLLLEDLRLTHGSRARGAAVLIGDFVDVTIRLCELDNNQTTGTGGAIDVQANFRLTIEDSTIRDNESGGSGGGIWVRRGEVRISGSTLARNTATSGSGGGIWSEVPTELQVASSTLSGNRADGHGGGLAVSGPVSVTASLTSTTVTDNAADDDQDGSGDGGGLAVLDGATISIGNTIVGANVDRSGASECPDALADATSALTSTGFSLVTVNSCVAGAFPTGNPNANNDQVGSDGSPQDPLLDALTSNGGPTQTHEPLMASPVIDQGSCTGEPGDQRGWGAGGGGRIVDDLDIVDLDDGCDIGSVERGAGEIVIIDEIFSDGFEGMNTDEWSEIAS